METKNHKARNSLESGVEPKDYWRIENEPKKEETIMKAMDYLNSKGISDAEIIKSLMHFGLLAEFLEYTPKERYENF